MARGGYSVTSADAVGRSCPFVSVLGPQGDPLAAQREQISVLCLNSHYKLRHDRKVKGQYLPLTPSTLSTLIDSSRPIRIIPLSPKYWHRLLKTTTSLSMVQAFEGTGRHRHQTTSFRATGKTSAAKREAALASFYTTLPFGAGLWRCVASH